MTLNRPCPSCGGDGGQHDYGQYPWAECPTCSGRGYLAGTVVQSELAHTPQARAQVRAFTRGRRGFALNPNTQQKIVDKQRRRNVED